MGNLMVSTELIQSIGMLDACFLASLASMSSSKRGKFDCTEKDLKTLTLLSPGEQGLCLTRLETRGLLKVTWEGLKRNRRKVQLSWRNPLVQLVDGCTPLPPDPPPPGSGKEPFCSGFRINPEGKRGMGDYKGERGDSVKVNLGEKSESSALGYATGKEGADLNTRDSKNKREEESTTFSHSAGLDRISNKKTSRLDPPAAANSGASPELEYSNYQRYTLRRGVMNSQKGNIPEQCYSWARTLSLAIEKHYTTPTSNKVGTDANTLSRLLKRLANSSGNPEDRINKVVQWFSTSIGTFIRPEVRSVRQFCKDKVFTWLEDLCRKSERESKRQQEFGIINKSINADEMW